MNTSMGHVLRHSLMVLNVVAGMGFGETVVMADASARKNVALGAKYTLWPKPNYRYCTDAGDTAQLTDGKLTDGYFWTQKGTVGWNHVKFVTITVDLERIEPIAGVSFRTAAGTAGVFWPALVRIHVSDDGKAYRDVGDLIALDNSGEPLSEKYAVRRFATSQLKTRGRYVRFLVIPFGPYVFTDEVEVFRGPDSLLDAEPVGKPVKSIEEFYHRFRLGSALRRRFSRDAAGAKEAIERAELGNADEKQLLDRLAKVRAKLMNTATASVPSSFRTILPFNGVHAEVFGIQAALWRSLGRPALTAWALSAWDPLDAFASLPTSPSKPIEVHTMLGEYRSAAFNLANATDSPMRVSIRFAGIPNSPAPNYITVHEVPWTDTISGQVVAAALPVAEQKGDTWQINVAPGLVRQVWLTFHVTDLPPGEHKGNIMTGARGLEQISVPLRLHVYPLSFPDKTMLWVGGWSYTDGKGARGITPKNQKPLVEHLRSRFVNAPWGMPQVLLKYTFKDGNPPTVELDTQRFDGWIKQWPDAKAYLVFINVRNTFAGTKMGTDAFNQRVGTWISAWVRHLAGKGISADRLGLLIVDEPHAHSQDVIIIAWAKAIRAVEPDVLIWMDPTYRDPKQGRPEMFAACDILCPNRPMWLSAGKAFAQFYVDQRNKGKTLQFYSCSGPARLLDPYSYYRLQAWHCWQIGGTGSFFWAFGDNGRASSWNEYLAVGGPYTPVFLDDQSVTAAKQMEAIRESAEDYEYFVMLRKAVDQAKAAGKTGPAVQRARSLLKSAADEVLDAEGVKDITWHAAKDRTKADRVRVQLLEALTALQSER